ncbi:amino acid ABC transporter substrate-binding pro tein [Desulfonema ishimotonii]|uniref:Amino acid ABC transporter substrate-binding pro tein n=2 Tax=Desulfonema ishimotonii TaxID=45657 RepID=A0A401FTT7_9BACT|nr:amino acid ABC transporter substrate-binding pro tein [Desulfonema ishimotonii]
MKIAVSPNPPWKMQDENEQFEGAEIEMFNYLAEKLNFEIQFKIAPFKRCLYYMEKGTADMMVGIFKNPEREIYIEYVEPPYKSRSDKSFYVLKGKKEMIRTYEDLYDLKIGMKNGVKYFPRFDADTKVKKDTVNENSLNIGKILTGRIDTFVVTSDFGDYMLRQAGATDKIEKAEFGYSKRNPVYIGISKKSPWMNRVGEVKSAVREMIESGTLDRIFADFFEKHNLPVPEYK